MQNIKSPVVLISGRLMKEFFSDKFFWGPNISLSDGVLNVDGVEVAVDLQKMTGLSDDAVVTIVSGDVFEDSFTHLHTLIDHYENWTSHYADHPATGDYSVQIKINVSDIQKLHALAVGSVSSHDEERFLAGNGAIDVYACLEALLKSNINDGCSVVSCDVSKDIEDAIFPLLGG